MIVCGAQVSPSWGDPEKGLARADSYVKSAARNGAHLVCFPEQFATGWDPSSADHAEEIGGPVSRGYAAIAGEHGVWVVGSIRERGLDLPRNSCIVFGPDGSLETVYAKIHPFSPAGEDRVYAGGDKPALFRVADLTIGVAICYDLRFAPLFQAYRDRGADAILVPSAWPAVRQEHFELFVKARACEQQLYVFGINTTGTTPVDRYEGGSLCAGPEGEVVARAGTGEELLFADLSRSHVQSVRKAFFITGNRRDDSYAGLRRDR